MKKKQALGAISAVKPPVRLSKGVAQRSATETGKLVQDLISRYRRQGTLRISVSASRAVTSLPSKKPLLKILEARRDE